MSKSKYQETLSRQLDLWLKGESIHNNDTPYQGGECCPDFSCCVPELKADEETRQRFYDAFRNGDTDTTNKMLGMFLEALVAHKTNKRIHIAGEEGSIQ